MPLMDRIKCKPFLSLTQPEQYQTIRDLQILRTKAIADEARKKVRKKKSPKKTKTTRKKKAIKITKTLEATLESMSIEQLKALAQKHGVSL